MEPKFTQGKEEKMLEQKRLQFAYTDHGWCSGKRNIISANKNVHVLSLLKPENCWMKKRMILCY